MMLKRKWRIHQLGISVMHRDQLTNNNVEGWHSYLNALFGLNKNLWDTIEMIQNEQIVSQLDYEKEIRGKPVAARRLSQIEKEKQIKRMQIIYRNKESSRFQFLRNIAAIQKCFES